MVSILAMSERTRWENISHLGTAALGCPAERSSAGFAGVEMNLTSIERSVPGRVSARDFLELWASDICEHRFLPLRRREIPIAGSGFVIVSTQAVGDGRQAPIVHTHLAVEPLA